LLDKSSLKDWLSRSDLERVTKLLVILACEPDTAQQVNQIRKTALQSGLPEAKNWNISHILKHSDGRVANIGDGWVLTGAGKESVGHLIGKIEKQASDLRDALPSIKGEETREFVLEAIQCYEGKNRRAAVVLSWVGAISVLYSHTVDSHLSAFNAEATKRDAKWRPAKNADGLGRMKEHDFLDVIESLSIIGKNVKRGTPILP